MEKLKTKYNYLKSQLSNPGEETTSCEVMWNDGIYISIDNLFENVNEEIINLIKLNLV